MPNTGGPLRWPKKTLRYQTTPSFEIYQGGTGFDTFWPLIYDGKLKGYLNGVFQVKRIMDICLAQDLFKDFLISIYEGERLIYHHGRPGDTGLAPNGIHALRMIDFSGKACHSNSSLTLPSASRLSCRSFLSSVLAWPCRHPCRYCCIFCSIAWTCTGLPGTRPSTKSVSEKGPRRC